MPFSKKRLGHVHLFWITFTGLPGHFQLVVHSPIVHLKNLRRDLRSFDASYVAIYTYIAIPLILL